MEYIGKKVAFALPISGLKHINFDKYENDFTFYVGDQMFQCNKFIADFLSPRVSEMRNCDSTIDSFYIPSSKCSNPHLFKLLLSLAKGYSIIITQSDLKPLSLLFKELGNTEFLNFYLSIIGPVDEKNVVHTIILKSEYNLPIETEISYLASHFYKVEKSNLDLLTSDQLYSIFSKKSLCVESEDWLFDFIFEKSNVDQSFNQLYEFIEFSALSCDKIMKFTTEVSLEDINYGIWKSICRKLQNERIGKKRKYIELEGSESQVNIPYSTLKEMKGIISYLSSKFHCNVGLMNIIKITVSSVFQPGKVFSPNNVVELLTNSSFKSKNEEDQWICFDFKDRRIIPSYYSIKSSNGSENCHLKSWAVESSDDGIYWKILDKQVDCDVFKNYCEFTNNIASFPIIRNSSKIESCRFIRIRQIEKNTANNNFLSLQGVEFYGSLIDKIDK